MRQEKGRLKLQHEEHDEIVRELIREIGRDDLTQLLEQAFGEASIDLASMRQGLSGSRVFKAHVVGNDKGPQISQVVKIGSRADLDHEVDNWHAFAERYLPRFPALIDKGHYKEWGVLDYKFEGHSTLGDRLQDCVLNNLIATGQILIDAVFDYFKMLHGTSPRAALCNLVVAEYPLKPEYFKNFDDKREVLERAATDQGLEPFRGVELTQKYWGSPHRIFRSRTHACHGDLHADNVVLDDRHANSPCAIDFGHTRLDHHFLKDCIALEADLSFRVLAPRDWTRPRGLEEFRSALKFLHTQFRFEPSDFDDKGNHAVRALLSFIARIREAAWNDMDAHDRHIPEYFLGLLRYAVSRCGLPANPLTDSQRWIAGHAANVLEEHLEFSLAPGHVHYEIADDDGDPGDRRLIEREDTNMPDIPDRIERNLVSRYIDALNGLLKFKARLNSNSDLKKWIAGYILTVYGTRIFRDAARHLFFESGSSIAYLAMDVNDFLTRRVRKQEVESFSIETNNIFACLEFALLSQLQVSLYPPGPPEGTYGATFGRLLDHWQAPLPEGVDWTDDPDESVIAPMREHFAAKYSKDGIIFMTASGIDITEDIFPGPHVGSYSNMLFKRVLLESKCPTMMVLDDGKIPRAFEVGSCYPVCHGNLSWADVCSEVPLAVAVALRTVKGGKEVIKYLTGMGLTYVHEGRANETPTGVILANEKFEKRFPR